MASSPDNISMAVFCDFENVALGVRDANYEKFDIKPVLERLLLKGSIVVKKAYCDWERYKGFKATMHEANFELIEIPHVRQSGKNSADIRLVVDALDLCYTKSHVNTFVIISGDSDFSPLVSKLRENNKQVIGVGVKQSTSDLLVANCDEFIFYDDLVREVKRAAAKRDERKAQPVAASAKRAPDEGNRRKEELEARKAQAIEMVVEMFDALVSERGDSGKIWASLLKDTLKRRRPEFNETYFGFRTFGNLLEEAQARGMLEFGRDEKSGAYVYRSNSAVAAAGAHAEPLASAQESAAAPDAAPELATDIVAQPEQHRRGRGGRNDSRAQHSAVTPEAASDMATEAATDMATDAATGVATEAATEVATEAAPELAVNTGAQREPHRRGRGGRTDFRAPAAAMTPEAATDVVFEPVAEPVAQAEPHRRGRGGRTDFRAPASATTPEAAPELAAGPGAQPEQRRRGRGGRTDFRAPVVAQPEAEVHVMPEEPAAVEVPQWNDESPFPPPQAQQRNARGTRKGSAKRVEAVFDVESDDTAPPAALAPVFEQPVQAELVEPAALTALAEPVEAAPAPAPAPKAARKPAVRKARPAKPKAAPEIG